MSVSIQTGAEPIPGYTLLDRLGSGGFGEVWRCEAPGGIFKAVKVIHGDLRQQGSDAYRFAEQELKSLKRVKAVRHPYLLALDRYDIVDGRLMIVMELADCNLWDRFRECRAEGLPGIPRDELMVYMSETAEVLDLMNDKHQLQHLDVKPQNLFLLYNHVKVADFGQVKDLELHVAQVTGGITPVYAAPETFDGLVSRYCDQYSLACVYQELLTGRRPFDGGSMNQLVVQHLQQPPDLRPSPEHDRPALARALSKKPDDRFPSVGAFVRALGSGDAADRTAAVARSGAVAVAAARGAPDSAYTPDRAATAVESPPPGGPPAYAQVSPGSGTPFPRAFAAAEVGVQPDHPAPPEVTGPGPLRPAVVIGVGYTGLRVLQGLHHALGGWYGGARRVPALRTVYVDTDADAAALAASPPPDCGLSPLPAEDVVCVRLHRAAHYLKPRNNGRALIEGWFDPQLLYKLPRVPSTMGLRSLGRLALCDHFRAVMAKLDAEVEAAVDPQALADTAAVTGLAARTNRPRVYVVAGLGGGTGGGMAIDLAYAVRHRLRRIGYADPEVVGLLFAPPDTDAVPPFARANAYAALTELNHFARPDTAYHATFDDRFGTVKDNSPPFTRVLVLPGLDPAATPPPVSVSASGSSAVAATVRRSGSVPRLARSGRVAAPAAPQADPLAPAAELIRLDLFTPVGRAADEARAKRPAAEHPTVAAAGLGRFGWPRAEVVDRTARVMAPVLLGHWVAADEAALKAVVPGWVAEQWRRVGLTVEQVGGRLKAAADRAAGGGVERAVRDAVGPLATPAKGWLARTPDATQVSLAVDRLVRLFGPPKLGPNRQASPLEEAVEAEGKAAAREAADELAALVPALLDTPAFRLAGTERAVRHLLAAADQCHARLTERQTGVQASAAAAFDRLTHHVHPQSGAKKLTPAELAEAVRAYPADGYEATVGRHALDLYRGLHDVLTARLAELTACRKQVEELHRRMAAEAEPPAADVPAALLPVGCRSVEEAAQKFLAVLTDDDLNELEGRFQHELTARYGGVFEACVNSAAGPEGVLAVLRTATRDYLNERLGEVDFAGMMRQKFGSTAAVGQAVVRAYSAAEPGVAGRGPWASAELTAFAAPPGTGGAAVARHAATVLPPETVTATTADEVVIVREYPHVPLAALPQLGPAWEAAYRATTDAGAGSPHARTDITRWLHVDE